MDPWRPVKPKGNDESFPDYSKRKPLQTGNDASHISRFPPHPSIRVASNPKIQETRPSTDDDSVPRPLNLRNASKTQLDGNIASVSSFGQLENDFMFPQPPQETPRTMHFDQRQEPSPQSVQTPKLHNSFASSIKHPPSAWPYSSAKSPPWSTPSFDRYSASVYADTEAPISPRIHDEQGAYRFSDKLKVPQKPPVVSARAPIAENARATLVTIRSNKSQTDPLGKDVPSPVTNSATISVLSAAVAAGMSSQTLSSRSPTPSSLQDRQTPSTLQSRKTPLRMPFAYDSNPNSPMMRPEDLEPPEILESAINRTKAQTPASIKSGKSPNPLLGLGIDQRSMSDRIPPERRPPRLNLDATGDGGVRSSVSSLAELIRRATKLAANLDLGKTASRHNTVYGKSQSVRRLKRNSTVSDMIHAFPVPTGTPRRNTMWPSAEKGSPTSFDSKHNSPRKRRCCGMSMPVFVVILVAAVIIIAAAVLIPVFVLVVPKQHQTTVDLTKCASSYPCQNGGTSVVSNNACNCICSNGFIGRHCDLLGTASDCTTATVTEGSKEYRNATMGSSIMPLFSDAKTRFNIPLNASVILSLFASSSLACLSENQLVDITPNSIAKRFVIVPGLTSPDDLKQPVPTPIATPASHKIEAREDPVGTSNGIVFQATSTTTSSSTTATATGASAVSTVTSISQTTSTSSAQAATPTSTSQATEEQIDFAKIVVLYVLQKSTTISIAVNAQQQLEVFLSSGNETEKVNVGYGNSQFTADFNKFSIEGSDGTTIGGKHT